MRKYTPKKKFTEQEREWLAENYPKLTRLECSLFLKRSIPSIGQFCLRNGILRRPRFNYGNEFKPDFNCGNFIYFLGFFWADGHLRLLGGRKYSVLKIQENDALTIEPFLKKLPFKLKFFDRSGNRKRCGEFFSGNQKFNEFLWENDFSEKSRLEPSRILSLIPNEKHYLFWKGFFDGDGCIVQRKNGSRAVSFSGGVSYKWIELSKYLQGIDIPHSIYRTKGKYGENSILIFTKASSVEKFARTIFLGKNEAGLFRKFIKFNGVYTSVNNQRIVSLSM